MEYPLRNPYRQTEDLIEEQPFEESFYNAQEEFGNSYPQNIAQTQQSFTSHSNLHQPEQSQDNPSQVVSQQNIKPTEERRLEVSGIHEKYLSYGASPLPKKMIQSERKGLSSQHSSIYGKKLKKSKTERYSEKNVQFINPLTDGLKGLQIDSEQLYQNLTTKIDGGEQEKCSVFLQLGLKQPKALGKGRAQRDLRTIMDFLSKGEMAEEYVADFLLLLNS